MCLDHPKIGPVVVKAAKNKMAPKIVNFVLNKHQSDAGVMESTIPLALKLCEKSPEFARKIDTKSLIPILIKEGNGLLDELGDSLSSDPDV